MYIQEFYTKYQEKLTQGELFQIKLHRFQSELPEHVLDIIKKYTQDDDIQESPKLVIVSKSKKDIDSIIQPFYDDRIKAMKQRAFIHSKLEDVATNEERHQIAIEIREKLTPEIERLSAIIDNYDENGTVPTVTTDEKKVRDETLRLVNKRRSLETDISQTKKRIENATDLTKKSNEEKRLEKLEAELKEVKQKLYD